MIEIYTDGACRGNPGPGSWRVVVHREDETKVDFCGEDGGPTTNQRMEIIAALKGLQQTPLGSKVTVHTSSQYVVNAMTGVSKRHRNLDLLKNLDDVTSERSVAWQHDRSAAKVVQTAQPPKSIVSPDGEQGIARYEISDAERRETIRDLLGSAFTVEESSAPLADWVKRISRGKSRVTATMYSTGTLLVQGRLSDLWDGVCSTIESSCSPKIKEIASRFISNSEEELDKFESRFSPALVSKGEEAARGALGAAFDYLEHHDQRYASTAFCLKIAGLSLPEYSAVVMPMAKAFEGYLATLLVKLRLVTRKHLKSPNFQIGVALDSQQWAKTKVFVGKSRERKGLIKMLGGELSFARHFVMHSNKATVTQVNSAEEAGEYLTRLGQSMRRSHGALVLKQ